MKDSRDISFNPDLWKNSADALSDDKWKWEDSTWDSAILRIITYPEGEIYKMDCPVCGAKKLYCHFVVFRLANRSARAGKIILVGDRWFGCDSCKVQVRDYGEIPFWEPGDNLIWASDEAREDTIKKIRDLNIPTGL